MKYISCLVISCAISINCFSQDSKRESVEELLKVADMDSMIDGMYAQIDQMFVNMGQQLGIRPSEQASFDKYMQKVAALMKEDMSWEKMRDPMIDIYLNHYSEKEIQDMLAFYRSDSGQSMVNKMPAVMEDSMKISQQMMTDFMPKLQTLAIELQEELQSIRNTE